MTKDDLIEEEYINFEEGIEKLSEKGKINDLKNKVLSCVVRVANAYTQLDALIAEGQKISQGKGESNGLTASDILSSFNVYDDCLTKNDKILEKVFDQKRVTINALKSKLNTQAKQEHRE